MTARSKPLGLALGLLVITAPLLAGCLSNDGSTWDQVRASVGLPADEISAMTAARTAHEEAAAWDADAVLYEVGGPEWDDVPGANASDGLGSDPDVGNGKAPAWEFTYVTEDASYSFIVHANLTATDHRERAPKAYGAAANASEWKVDSDAAMKALRADAEWQEKTDGDLRATMIGLSVDDGKRVWGIVAWDDRDRGIIGVVDATSGAITYVGAWDAHGGWGDWDWSDEWGGDWDDGWSSASAEPGQVTHESGFTGTLTPLEPTAEHTFPVETEGQWIEVTVERRDWMSIVGPAEAAARVLDADGNEVPLHATTDEGPLVGYAPHAGSFTLEMNLEGVTPVYVTYEATVVVGHAPYARG